MYAITYLLPTQGINWGIIAIQEKIDGLNVKENDDSISNILKKYIKKYSLVFDYLFGSIIIIILLSLEAFVISKYISIYK
jgi:hypothetical protein